MNNEILMPFIDESPEFVHGFECGQIWEKIKRYDKIKAYPFHCENSAQIQTISDYYKVKCEIKITDDTWGTLTIIY